MTYSLTVRHNGLLRLSPVGSIAHAPHTLRTRFAHVCARTEQTHLLSSKPCTPCTPYLDRMPLLPDPVSEVDPQDYLGGVTVFELGLSLPWHKPILAKAVRTVYLRNAVFLFSQYNRLGGRNGLLPKHHSVPRGPSVLSLSGGPTLVSLSCAPVT